MSRSHAPAGRLLLACVLIALGSSTWGSDPVYKCRDHAGQAHYQASPCPTTQHTEWRREYPDKPSAQTDAGPIARLSQRERFHWLVAPRSTIIQVSAVHSGICDQPADKLEQLFERLIATVL